MEFPQIPTDSLYKFMALSGLAIVVTFIVFPGQKLLEIEKQSVQIQGEYKISCLEFDERTKESQKIISDQKKLLAEYDRIFDSHDLSAATKKRVDTVGEKLNNEADRVHEKLVQTEILKIKTDSKLNELKANGVYFRNTLRILAIGSVLGGVMTIFGFILWYTKIQVLQDRLLAMQVEASAPNPPLNSDPTATA